MNENLNRNALIIKHIIKPALQEINAYSKRAESLVFKTGAAESLYQHVRQVKGPALSWFQIEPRTHDDIWMRFIPARPELQRGLERLTFRPGVSSEMEVNPFYAAAMCRIVYLRVSEPLPETNNPVAQADYWKRYYNSMKGAGTTGGFLEKVTEVCNE